MEIWKDIKGYKGLYQVSNKGRVKSLERDYATELKGKKILIHKNEQIMKTHFSNYERVALYKNGKEKRFLVHRLVAEAFVENPDNKPVVDHIIPLSNGGTNEASNLKWCTPKENSNNKITRKHISEALKNKPKKSRRKPIIGIDKKTNKEISFSSITEAAMELNGSGGNISSALNGKIPSAYGYLWYFK